MEERQLGVIRKTFLGFEDHDIFTFVLDIYFGGSGQGFGNIALDYPSRLTEKVDASINPLYATEVIMSILNAVGVRSWEELPSSVVWVKRNASGKIKSIEAPDFRTHNGEADLEKIISKYRQKKDGE